jgi:hypothetical protein
MELGVLDKPPFEESLRELTARRLAAQGHPSPEDLAAYRAGELGTEQHERIKDHLAICEDCSQLVLDLAEFEQFEPGQNLTPADAQAEVSWQRLRGRLKDEGELDDSRVTDPAPILAPHPSRRRVPAWQRPAIPWALAAGLALCVVGLELRVGSLGREVRELSKPQVVPAFPLVSEEDAVRGGSDSGLSAHTGKGVSYDLSLPSDPRIPTYPLYSVQIVPAAGSAQPIRIAPRPAEDGVLRIFLPSAPEPGDYYFQVFGVQGEKETSVGRYPFKVLPVHQP